MQGTQRFNLSSLAVLRFGLCVLIMLLAGIVVFFPAHSRADTTIVTHQAVGSQIPVGQTGTLSVSCASGEQLLSGGFSGDAFEGAVYTTENYPSTANTWTVTVNNKGGPSWVQMAISVNCIQSTSPIPATIVHTTGSGTTTVATCPAGSVLVGGGYSGVSGLPMSGPLGNGWQTNEANAYAVCVTQGLTADAAVSTTFSVPGANENAGANVSCPAGQLTTGGGFSSGNPIVSSQLGTGGWGVSAAGINFNPATMTAWAVCASLSLSGSTPTPGTTATVATSPTPCACGTTPTPTLGTTPTATATATPAPDVCKVSYRVTAQWPGGFGAALIITNTGSTPINGWTLQWSFANGQTITQLWNGSYTQSGSAVTVTNLAYNGNLAPGGTAQPGFNGTWSGTNTAPTAFTLNGHPCTLA